MNIVGYVIATLFAISLTVFIACGIFILFAATLDIPLTYKLIFLSKCSFLSLLISWFFFGLYTKIYDFLG